MPKRARILIVLLVMMIGGAMAWFFWDKPAEPPTTRHLTLYGNIDLRQVNLAFNDAARIEHILVQVGDAVVQGQVIATLDTRRYAAALAAAKAQLAANQAVLDKLIHGSRPEDIERLRAVVAADQADLTNLESTYRRIAHLAAQKMASAQDRDAAHAARDAASARMKADEATLKLAVIGARVEDINQARAAVDAASAQVQTAQINLDDTTLNAPSVGIVRNRIVEPGDMASPAQPIVTLALTDPIWARVYLSEPDLGWVREGMPATISSDSFPGKTFIGWVGYVSPTAEFTPKTVETTTVRTDLVYQARVYACNPNHDLRLGMPVTVQIARSAKPIARGENPCTPPNPER
jgi:HlyD family secretion protein